MEPTDLLLKTLERALLTLKTVVGTLRLYPRQSPICQQSLQGAHEPIQTYLQRVDHIVINDTGKDLATEGKPIQVKGLRELMVPHAIRNLRISRGVTQAEISTLC